MIPKAAQAAYDEVSRLYDAGTNVRGRHIVVVGAGIVGLCIAYEAALLGNKVTVLEKRGTPGELCSAASAGMLYEPSFARPLLWAFSKHGINRHLSYRETSHLPGYQVGSALVMTQTESAAKELLRQHGKDAAPADIKVQPVEITAPQFHGVRINDEVSVWTQDLMEALVDRIRAAGGEVRFNTEVVNVGYTDTRIEALQINNSDNITGADHYVFATGFEWRQLSKKMFVEEIKIQAVKGETLQLEIQQPLPYDIRWNLPSRAQPGAAEFAKLGVTGLHVVRRARTWVTLGSTVRRGVKESGVSDEIAERLVEWGARVLPWLKNAKVTDRYFGWRPLILKTCPEFGSVGSNGIWVNGAYRSGVTMAPSLGAAVLGMLAEKRSQVTVRVPA